MQEYTIYPLVVGINETDQGVMTYLRDYGKRIHLPIYAFYIEGGDRRIGLRLVAAVEGHLDRLVLHPRRRIPDPALRRGVLPAPRPASPAPGAYGRRTS